MTAVKFRYWPEDESESDYEDYGSSALALVIDHGSSMMKAGFGGDDAPRAVFPTIVGYPRDKRQLVGMAQKECYIGDEAQSKRGILNLFRPIEYGEIMDFKQIEKVYHHSFYNELCLCPEEHCVLLTERFGCNSKRKREHITQIIMETFNCEGMCLANSSLLALIASGRTSGIVVDSGYVTQVVPVSEGCIIENAVLTAEIGGQEVTQYLLQLLNDKKQYFFSTLAEREIVRDIKEKTIFVADKKALKDKYELPDGTVIDCEVCRFSCIDCLFQPHLIGKENQKGLNVMFLECIEKLWQSHVDVVNLCKNTILSGGNTMLFEIDKRIENGLNFNNEILVDGYLRSNYNSSNQRTSLYNDVVNLIHKYTPETKIKVYKPPERKYSTWIGGSIISSTRSFEDIWITPDEYREIGIDILNRKTYSMRTNNDGYTEFYSVINNV